MISKSSTIDKMKKRDDWLGFGYIGHAIRNDEVDKIVCKVLNELKLSDEKAFIYLNSKLGRWLGDELSYRKDVKEVIVRDLKELELIR